MQRVHNLKKKKNFRRKLRKNLTTSERIFWNKIRHSQSGYKFRRQHSIGPYIVDFYCPKLNIIIEIDGDVHAIEEQIKKDKIREDYLGKLNFKIIRYNNNDIINNIDGVLEDLYKKLNF